MISKEDIEKFISMDMPSAKAGEILRKFVAIADDPGLDMVVELEKCKAELEKVIASGAENLSEFADEDDTKVTDHPKRYLGKSGVEAIDIIEHTVMMFPGDLAFNIGTAVKYLTRLGKKKTTDEAEDWKKTLWYTNRALSLVK